MSRVEQVERNRDLVLAAARRVFLHRGYSGATLDAIAQEAGFSKGVVYSCLLYTSPSPRDKRQSRMPSSA